MAQGARRAPPPRGLPAIAPDAAITGLGQALADGDPQLTVADVDWARFAPAFSVSRARPLLTGVPEAAKVMAPAEDPVGGGEAAFTRLLADTPASERQDAPHGAIRREAAAVLATPTASSRSARTGVPRARFDSLTGVELRDRLARLRAAAAGDAGLRLPDAVGAGRALWPGWSRTPVRRCWTSLERWRPVCTRRSVRSGRSAGLRRPVAAVLARWNDRAPASRRRPRAAAERRIADELSNSSTYRAGMS